MITRTNIPASYQPYSQIIICSNTLLGGSHFLVVGDVLPLLIGRGEIPQVWLQAPTDKSGKEFVLLVSASVATHPAVTVTSDPNGLTVLVAGQSLLHVMAQPQGVATIDFLDFRPIGFNVFGNATALTAGGNTFIGSTFSGGALLAISSER